jgi:predicted enzyme related to lactoylglutathione lyase
MVRELAFVAYSVRDVPRAIAFYRDVLGLEPGELFSEHWAEFNLGNGTFGIGNGEGLGMAPGSSSGVAFEVDDLAATRDRLIRHGSEPTEIKEFPNCSVVFASDPEGNKFAVHQRKAAASR